MGVPFYLWVKDLNNPQEGIILHNPSDIQNKLAPSFVFVLEFKKKLIL